MSGAETASFHYDANGNQLQGSTQNQYNLADQLVKASKGATQVEFAYAPDGDRYVRIDQSNGKRQTTLSLGGYERVDDETWLTHKYSVGGIVLITETEKPDDANSFSRDLSYLVKDYLGSVRLELDAQGKERNLCGFPPLASKEADPRGGILADGPRIELNRLQNRGSTYHEEIASLGLIHMNGRVYDPKLARFLQADPYVQDAGNLQALNRYSYVENNPFAATDPSGFFLKKLWNKIRPFVGVIVAVVLTVIAPQGVSVWYSVFVGAASGAAGAAANGGNILQGALIGGVTAAAFVGVGQGMKALAGGTYASASTGWKAAWVGAHAVTGGALAKVQGGQFRNGFISAGISKGVDGYLEFGDSPTQIAAETLAVAVVGGTTSQLTGGKFSNGAQTAAFAHLFNELATSLRESQDRKKAYERLDKALAMAESEKIPITRAIINLYKGMGDWSQLYTDKKFFWDDGNPFRHNFTQAEHYQYAYGEVIHSDSPAITAFAFFALTEAYQPAKYIAQQIGPSFLDDWSLWKRARLSSPPSRSQVVWGIAGARDPLNERTNMEISR